MLMDIATEELSHAEEGNWFPDLKQKASPENQPLMTARYSEEYARYVGTDAQA